MGNWCRKNWFGNDGDDFFREKREGGTINKSLINEASLLGGGENELCVGPTMQLLYNGLGQLWGDFIILPHARSLKPLS